MNVLEKNQYPERFRDNNYFRILELSDAKLRTEDGHTFNVHRCALAKSSYYFYAQFCGIGRGRTDILIPGIRGVVLNDILSYIYSDNLHLSEENVCELLIAADYLLVDSITLHIKAHLGKTLSVNNCVELFMVTMQINQVDMLREIFRFIQMHFEAVVLGEASNLELMSLEALKQFLSDKNLGVTNERTVSLAIVKWVMADFEHRKIWVFDLLTYLNLCDINEQQATEILEHEIVANNPICKRINDLMFDSSFNSNIEIFRHCIQNYPKSFLALYSHRLPTTLYFIAQYCVYNQADGIQIYITYDENIDWWRKMVDFAICPEFLLSIGDNIYMFSTSENKNFRYSLDQKQLIEMNNFDLERYDVVKLDQCVYVLGGISVQTGHEMYDVKVYDPFDNVWYNASPMMPITYFIAASLDEYIYVVGNTTDSLRFEMMMQVYSPELDQWSLLPPPSISRYNFALISYHGKLHLIGGTQEDEYIKNVEVYDPVRQQWTVHMDLPFPYYLPKAIILDDDLFVYDNHLEDRSYMKTYPPVVWNDMHGHWKPVDNASHWIHLHKYCFFNPENDHCLETLSKENKNFPSDFMRSPFY